MKSFGKNFNHLKALKGGGKKKLFGDIFLKLLETWNKYIQNIILSAFQENLKLAKTV